MTWSGPSPALALDVRCACCGTTARARRVTVDLGQLGAAVWTKMPPGWWTLEGIAPEQHCRCPACLKPKEATT